ncbi:MAG: hypothetical protein HYU77_08750 [Betaproteobacteria bacterium]|nr:hypothetical protein [Betaproteobacteria bacterium]
MSQRKKLKVIPSHAAVLASSPAASPALDPPPPAAAAGRAQARGPEIAPAATQRHDFDYLPDRYVNQAKDVEEHIQTF